MLRYQILVASFFGDGWSERDSKEWYLRRGHDLFDDDMDDGLHPKIERFQKVPETNFSDELIQSIEIIFLYRIHTGTFSPSFTKENRQIEESKQR